MKSVLSASGSCLHRVDDAAHLVVALGPVAGEHLHHAGVEPLLVGVERVPRRQALGALGQLRVLRDDAELLLPRERLLAILRPSRCRTCP